MGEWWTRRHDEQIDVVALSGDGHALVGECQWGEVDMRDLEALKRRAHGLLSEADEPLEIRYALFSGRGPADQELRDAIDRGEVLHFGLDDLYAI